MSIGGQMIDNERTGVRRRDEVNGQCNQRKSCHESAETSPVLVVFLGETERVHDVEPSGSSVRGVELADRGDTQKPICKDRFRAILGIKHILLGHVVANAAAIVKEVGTVIEVGVSESFEFFGLASLTQSNAAKCAEPEEGVNKRGHEGVDHDLADRTSTGDTSKEKTDKGTPSGPPSHVKYGPATHPPGFGRSFRGTPFTFFKLPKGVRPKRNLEDTVLEVVTSCLHGCVENVLGVFHDEAEEEQGQTKAETNLRQQFDTDGKSRNDRGSSNEGDDPNDQDLFVGFFIFREIGIHPSQALGPCSNLNGTQTERGTDTSNRHDNGETIDNIANPSPCVVTKDLVEG
mmetsp:Transcript_11556/g.22128  ORF Transcript_11556/g.22128 Transcript_11556/m.22128 type:complete len:346 (+) Transcript_11556:968-2005(+)